MCAAYDRVRAVEEAWSLSISSTSRADSAALNVALAEILAPPRLNQVGFLLNTMMLRVGAGQSRGWTAGERERESSPGHLSIVLTLGHAERRYGSLEGGAQAAWKEK